MSEAEDRDLPASQRRLDQARAEGRVPLSREVATIAVLAAGVMVLSVGGPGVARTLIGGLVPFLEDAHRMGALAGARSAALVGLAMLAPFALAIVLAGGAAVLLQTGMHMNTKAFTPDFSRISPMTGFGRIFGTTTLAEAGKSLLKIAVVGYAGWIGARGLRPLRYMKVDPQAIRGLGRMDAKLADELEKSAKTADVTKLKLVLNGEDQ